MLTSKINEQGCYLKTIVLYSSKSGNTEKIAREISSELNCRCEKISDNFDSSLIDLDYFDNVFLGTGIYGGKPNAEMLNYLKEINLNNNLIFPLFMTWFGRGTSNKDVYYIIKKVIEEKGQRLMENFYSCLFQGPFIISRLRFPDTIGHLNAEDLSNARKWAKEIVKSISDFEEKRTHEQVCE